MRQPSGCRAEAQNWLSGGGMAKRPAPFSLRLTFEQRARLERDAGKMSLGAYIHSRLFAEDDDGMADRRHRPRKPVADEKALAQLMGMLGQSRLSSNLNQLAKSANTGSLPVTPDTETALMGNAEHLHTIVCYAPEKRQAAFGLPDALVLQVFACRLSAHMGLSIDVVISVS